MANEPFKKVEIRHAKDHNAIELGETSTGGKIRRIGPTGLDYPDSVSKILAIESKLRDTLPQWLKDDVQQSIDNELRYRPKLRRGKLARKIIMNEDAIRLVPVVILHENVSPYKEDLVVMRDDIFREIVMPLLEDYAFWHDPQ